MPAPISTKSPFDCTAFLHQFPIPWQIAILRYDLNACAKFYKSEYRPYIERWARDDVSVARRLFFYGVYHRQYAVVVALFPFVCPRSVSQYLHLVLRALILYTHPADVEWFLNCMHVHCDMITLPEVVPGPGPYFDPSENENEAFWLAIDHRMYHMAMALYNESHVRLLIPNVSARDVYMLTR